MGDCVLKVRLQAGYRDTQILQDVAFSLSAGECLGVVGRSGAGKSTLVLSLLGLAGWHGAWAKGEVLLQGKNLLQLRNSELRCLLGRSIALIPQAPLSALNPKISLQRHFIEAWKAHRKLDGSLRARIHELAEQVDLPTSDEFWRRRANQVSVGQAQRVTIALALLHGPRLVIADEPTSALDWFVQSEVLELLARVVKQESSALLFISHDLISVLRLCDRMAILDGGKLTESLRVPELSKSATPEFQRALSSLPMPLDLLLPHVRPEPIKVPAMGLRENAR